MVNRIIKTAAIGFVALAAACGSDDTTGPLEDVDAIVFIERQARMGGMGDIFQYRSYIPGAKLMKLSPPTADGELTQICCDQDPAYAEIDIIDFDINHAGNQVVVSARIGGDDRYQLSVLSLDTGEITPVATDPNYDAVYPAFLPQDRIVFATNAPFTEDGIPNFRDEYERGDTLQMGAVNIDGSNYELFAPNVSHKGISPTVLADGRVLATKWDHVANSNAGHLIAMNPDGTREVEAFGKEGTGATNSYYKATEAAPGHLITIASSRDRTFQSGTILQIFLGNKSDVDGEVRADDEMSEATASYKILTPQVPRGDAPSFESIGRYYNAYPLNAKEYPDLLVSWADGPVQSDVNGAAGVSPDFGIYLYNSERGTRQPIYNKADTWEINPTPLVVREAPRSIEPAAPNGFNDEAVLLGAMNVYESSIRDFEPGSIYGVRIIEGFSTEHGIPDDFGLTEHEGAAILGVVPVQNDGSWAATIPAGTPVRQQAIDIYGMTIQGEPVWISGNAGESRFCGGCHESRTNTTIVQPGITDAIAIGPVDLMTTIDRPSRQSNTFTINGAIGIPWDQALQPIFDAKCVSCHEGTPGPANKSVTITDPESGMSQTITFDLRGGEATYGVGDEMFTGYSVSHLSVMGVDMMELNEAGLEVSGDMPAYCEPGNARGSVMYERLNPMQIYPTVDVNNRAFAVNPHLAEVTGGAQTLTPDEMYTLVMACDLGGQFYSRENAPNAPF